MKPWSALAKTYETFITNKEKSQKVWLKAFFCVLNNLIPPPTF